LELPPSTTTTQSSIKWIIMIKKILYNVKPRDTHLILASQARHSSSSNEIFTVFLIGSLLFIF
jgi:hypothetical protein